VLFCGRIANAFKFPDQVLISPYPARPFVSSRLDRTPLCRVRTLCTLTKDASPRNSERSAEAAARGSFLFENIRPGSRLRGLDASGLAEVDAVRAAYEGLIYAKTAPEFLSPRGVLVRADVANQQAIATSEIQTGDTGGGPTSTTTTSSDPTSVTPPPQTPAKPHRFYGSVEIDMNRPVKAFDTILNSVVMELQRSPGAKVKLTLEIEAEAPSGFNDADVGVVRDNTKQLKFTPGSTGFAE
jgi:hypothetical protein